LLVIENADATQISVLTEKGNLLLAQVVAVIIALRISKKVADWLVVE
jgi:hypothetical protein